MNPQNNQGRVASIDILKCLSMLFIVIIHFYGHGFVKKDLFFDGNTVAGWFNFVVSEVLFVLANSAVDIFIIITGYFLISQERMQWRKIARIWLQVLFYSVLITACFVLFTDSISNKELLKSFIPIKSNTYWFATKYVGLLAIAPFIARLCKNLTRKEYLILLGVMIFLTTEIYKFPYGYTFDEMYGTNLQFFVTLFLTGGYLRLYPPKNTFVYFALCFSFALLYRMIPTIISCLQGTENKISVTSGPYNSISFYVAISFFLWFRGLNFKETKIVRFFIKLVPYTFGVYLLHDHVLTRSLIWTKIVDESTYADSYLYVMYMTICVLTIYSIGIFVDCLRKKLFDVLHVDKILSKIPD